MGRSLSSVIQTSWSWNCQLKLGIQLLNSSEVWTCVGCDECYTYGECRKTKYALKAVVHGITDPGLRGIMRQGDVINWDVFAYVHVCNEYVLRKLEIRLWTMWNMKAGWAKRSLEASVGIWAHRDLEHFIVVKLHQRHNWRMVYFPKNSRLWCYYPLKSYCISVWSVLCIECRNLKWYSNVYVKFSVVWCIVCCMYNA